MMKKVISPEGLQVVAQSVGVDSGSELRPATDDLEIVTSGWLIRKYECGHYASRWFQLTLYGEKSAIIRQKKQCPKCFLEDLKKHTIHCCLCGLSILPGDGVALYRSDSEDIDPKKATKVGEMSAIGCLRSSCCPSGGYFAGHWTTDGFKPAFD